MTDEQRKIVDRKALKSMSPEAVTQALKDGHLDLLLRGVDVRKGSKLSTAKWVQVLKNMTAEDFEQAKADGLIPAELLGEDASPEPPADADLGARAERFSMTRSGQRARLRAMTPAEVREALMRGDLDALLRGELAP